MLPVSYTTAKAEVYDDVVSRHRPLKDGRPARLLIACFAVCAAILRVNGIPCRLVTKHNISSRRGAARRVLCFDRRPLCTILSFVPWLHNFPSAWRSGLWQTACPLICLVVAIQSSRPISINSRLDCAKPRPHPETNRAALPTHPPRQVGRLWRTSLKIGGREIAIYVSTVSSTCI